MGVTVQNKVVLRV